MGCVKLHILDEQYKRTELQVSYINKELTSNNSAENLRRWMLLRYNDPTGEKLKWWQALVGFCFFDPVSAITTVSVAAGSAVATWLPFSNPSYELQKYISPIAFKPSFNFGSIQNGIGFDVSVGMLKGIGPNARFHTGATYYWGSYGGYNGLETRTGFEFEVAPLISYSTTKFTAGEFSQTTGKISIGDPFTNISYENDNMFGLPGPDNQDRWRSAAVGLNFGLLSVNLNVFTGDPGPYSHEHAKMINGHMTYTAYDDYDPNKYRAGVLSLSFGPIRFGRNSEGIRKVFQNQFAHDFLTGGKSLWFEVLPIPASWYWSFGFGTGDTLW